MNHATDIAKQINAIDVKISQERERKKDLVAHQKDQVRKQENSKCFLIGRSLLQWAGDKPDRIACVDKLLETHLTKDGERKKFGLKPKSKPAPQTSIESAPSNPNSAV